MYILDKYKDYYDYVSGIYGVDKSITFDRRGSNPINELEYIGTLHRYNPNVFSYKEDAIFLALEVGYVQYLFKYSDFKYKKVIDKYGLISYRLDTYKCELVRTYKDNKHYFEKEISIVPYHPEYHFDWKHGRKNGNFTLYEYEHFSNGNYETKDVIPNPILKDTAITTYILADEVWKELLTYISSKGNDKVVDIVNSDIQKIENHGFDKKSSFRNPIKL